MMAPPFTRHHTAAKNPTSASASSAGADTPAAGTAALGDLDGAVDEDAPAPLSPPADGPPASGARAGEGASAAAGALPARTSLLLAPRLSAWNACLSGAPPVEDAPTCHTWFTAFIPLRSCSLPYTRILPPAASAARSVAGKSSGVEALPSGTYPVMLYVRTAGAAAPAPASATSACAPAMPSPVGFRPHATHPPAAAGAATNATDRELLDASYVQCSDAPSFGRSSHDAYARPAGNFSPAQAADARRVAAGEASRSRGRSSARWRGIVEAAVRVWPDSSLALLALFALFLQLCNECVRGDL
uniref:Uncharacterized protein n=1 Tax=Zea mays TaxID=4577 RepID=C0P2J6_MAIZE|nr:unknown [Zea mays]